MKQYEKFSDQEIISIITTSNSYEEALSRLGYVNNTPNRSILRGLAKQYNLSLDHFISAQTTNLTGNRYGRLTVMRKCGSSRGRARWLCQCDCGQQKEIDGNHLMSGTIQSCGCLQKEKIVEYNTTQKLQNLIGQRFGKLVVLKRGPDIGQQPSWICQCDCGQITHPIMGSNLRRKNGTKSCGCLVSAGEAKIRELLKNNNINFDTQVQFSDCVSVTGTPLRFDFGVYDIDNNLLYLIEYQGIQHYSEVAWTHDDLAIRQQRDNIKREYCKKNNIPLIEIPYTLFSKLSIQDLLLDKEI